MVKGNLLIRQIGLFREQVVKEERIFKPLCIRIRIQIWDQHRIFKGWQRLLQFPDDRYAVKTFPAVLIPVHCKQQFWLDLFEAVNNASGAEIRRTAGPDRPDAGAGEKRDDRLGYIGHERYDPVSLFQSHLSQ